MTSSISTEPCDVVIVGGSAAGLSAALALGRSRRRVVVIDAGHPRNVSSAHVHGVLGHDGLSPAEFLDKGRHDLEPYDIALVEGIATDATRLDDGTFRVALQDGRTHSARALLAATGVRDELPDIPGLGQRWGIDVLHCPYCHGWEVRDQRIVVLCTSPMSVHSALMFRQLSDDVALVLHNDARPTAQESAKREARSIVTVEGPVTDLMLENDRLQGVRLRDGEILAAQALVVAPRADASTPVLDGLGLQPTPHPMGPEAGTMYAAEPGGRTTVAGVWAAGNICDPMGAAAKSVADGYLTGAMINADLVMQDASAAVVEGAAAQHSPPTTPGMASTARRCR